MSENDFFRHALEEAQKDLESQNDFERALGPARYKLKLMVIL